jgi:hypothetical protein
VAAAHESLRCAGCAESRVSRARLTTIRTR